MATTNKNLIYVDQPVSPRRQIIIYTEHPFNLSKFLSKCNFTLKTVAAQHCKS